MTDEFAFLAPLFWTDLMEEKPMTVREELLSLRNKLDDLISRLSHEASYVELEKNDNDWINELNLDCRARRTLLNDVVFHGRIHWRHPRSLDDLCSRTPEELLCVKNCGEVTVRNIQAALNKIGRTLKVQTTGAAQ